MHTGDLPTRLEIRDSDRVEFQLTIAPWLPERIFDVHTHVSLKEHLGPISPERFKSIWALEVGVEQRWEQLREAYRLLFPGTEVECLVFGGVYREMDIAAENAYVLSGAKDPANQSRALYVCRPEQTASEIEAALDSGFAGLKPYPDLSPSGIEDSSIFEFLPCEHLKVLNERKGVLMLHISRPGRLADPRNISEILVIHETYTEVRMVVAHVGRSFCLPTAEKSLTSFADAPGIVFDTSANLNADVFTYFLETLGPDRLLFGSDLPITLMRGEREYDGEKYINYTDAPYSWNTNRKPPEVEAGYTFFLYRELQAIIQAVQRAGMGQAEIDKICWLNSQRLFSA